jgi:parallel beta-helix repeat protein
LFFIGAVVKRTALTLALIIALSVSAVVGALLFTRGIAKTITVPDDYPTITAAVAGSNNGDIIFVRAGTYDGPINQTIVIDKPLSIVGESADKTIINLYPAYNVSWILTAPFFSYSNALSISADHFALLNVTVVIANPGGYISATGNQIKIIGNNITTGSTTGITVHGSYCKMADNIMGGRIQFDGSFNEVERNSLFAIYADGTSNIIKDNVCEFLGLGYYSNHTTNNVVSGNRVTTSNRGYSGISLFNSNNNFFCRNRLLGFCSGFELRGSSSNTITANTIADSLNAGINLWISYNNAIYLNNFVDNMFGWTPHVIDQYSDPNIRLASPNASVSIDFWDNGKEGNYWEGYNGSDVNGDGVGDNPFVINADNQDRYPLMTQVDIYNVPVLLPEWALEIDNVIQNLPDISDLTNNIAVPPRVIITSPCKNLTYNDTNVSLVFTVDEPIDWAGYSLDGRSNATIHGNTTITDLSNGLHTLTVYANDTFGNTGNSEDVSFNVAVPEPFPTVPVAVASGASIAAVAIGILLYVRKRKQGQTT